MGATASSREPALRRGEIVALGVVVVATAAAGVLHFAGAPGVPTFVVATIALAGLAWIVSFATEQVGERFGPAVTGFLQSTLGNLPEFFIVVFALSAGETVVAQTSLVGSLLVNALLVLGLVILAGSRQAEDDTMRFRTRLPNDTATLMVLSTFIIVLVGLSIASHDPASHHVEAVSTIGAVAILVVYVAWLSSYLRSDRQPEGAGAGGGATPRLPLAAGLGLLGLAGVGSAFVSDWFIGALNPAIETLHLSKAFAGLVIVAIAGNAVENVTGVVLAAKGQSDLAISVVKNSVAQIAAFLFPALVLVSLLFTTHLTFALAPVYIGALTLTAIAVWQITGDGEANMFEGLALIAIYVILASVALYE
jgi:Ca2+:H+ antiporter